MIWSRGNLDNEQWTVCKNKPDVVVNKKLKTVWQFDRQILHTQPWKEDNTVSVY